MRVVGRLFVAVCFLISSHSARGATTTSDGTSYLFPATSGAAGNPGGPGAAGAAGGDGVADVVTPDLVNDAEANGGNGQAGGNGGAGSPAGANGGPAGAGGAGGAAHAEVANSGPGAARSVANATGGTGGAAGFPGPATAPGLVGAGAPGGRGGDAVAVGALDAETPAPAQYGELDSLVNAFGGLGGTSPVSGGGGNATATSRTTTTSDGKIAALAGANGGAGGSGFGVSPVPGAGGNADARASAEGFGSGSVRALAGAHGGDAGDEGSGGVGGVAHAEASGISHGGGDVMVGASQFAGGSGFNAGPGTAQDSVMVDAVSGATSGLLTLEQDAVGGPTRVGKGGNAVSLLHAGNPFGGRIQATVSALGGSYYHLTGANGGDALAGGTVTDVAGSDVSIEVDATGADSEGAQSVGGSASLQPVFATSAGGAATAKARAQGGAGATGADESLSEIVGAQTSGAITLEQAAVAGAGSDGAGGAATGGKASSVLHVSTSSASISALVDAEGGDGSLASGTGDATVEVTNAGGSATAKGFARGGSNGGFPSAVAGSTANASSQASSFGDGHAVEADSTAFGGGGSGNASGNLGGVGADAHATSVGVANGDAPVTVSSQAEGGTGGASQSGNALIRAVGGNAYASSTASGTGASPVSATSAALGGNVGPYVTGAVGPSNASAVSQATGGGFVFASSDTSGRAVGLADSRALDAGTRGLAAHATISGQSDIVGHHTAVAEIAGDGFPFSSATHATGGDAMNLAWVAPPSSARIDWTAGDTEVDARVAGAQQIYAVGAAGAGATIGTLDMTEEFSLATPEDKPVELAFPDYQFRFTPSSHALDLLHISATADGTRFLDLEFHDAASADAWFADNSVVIPQELMADGKLDLSLAIDLADGNPSPFLYYIVGVAVFTAPEPGVTALVALGFAALSVLRRSLAPAPGRSHALSAPGP